MKVSAIAQMCAAALLFSSLSQEAFADSGQSQSSPPPTVTQTVYSHSPAPSDAVIESVYQSVYSQLDPSNSTIDFIPPVGSVQDSVADALGPHYGSLDMPKVGSTREELLAYRTPKSQTFLNKNGSYTTIVYGDKTFYKDSHHLWHTVNNQLIPSQNPKYDYQNAANDFNVLFSVYGHRSGTVLYSKGADTLSFQVVSAVRSSLDNPSKQSIKPDFNHPERGNAYLKFQGLLPDTSLQYRVLGNGIKEQIILKSSLAPQSYEYLLNTKGMILTSMPDGSIDLTDERSGHSIGRILAPQMEDSAGVSSRLVSQSLVSIGNNAYDLTITANENWLADPSRVYPVLIDPSVTDNLSTIQDTFISQQNAASNYYGSTYVYAGSGSGYDYEKALVNVQLPVLLAGATGASIQSAYLNYDQVDSSGTYGLAVQAETVTSAWNPYTVSYNTQPSTGSVLDTQNTNATGSSNTGQWSFNITNAVQQWYSGMSNDGIELVPNFQLHNTPPYATTQFLSAESQAGGNMPTVSITYTVNPLGQTSYWTNTEDGINVADGNLTLNQADESTPYRGSYTMDITRTYNSANSEMNLPGHINLFGYGWSSMLDMSVTDPGNHSGPVVFVDAQGLQHFFVPSTSNGTYVTNPVDHLTLAETSNGDIITLEDGTQYHFNSSGKLSAIVNLAGSGNQNSTILNYGGNGWLSSVVDPSGRMWNITENGDGTLSTITDPAGRVLTYGYDGSKHLLSVSFSAQSGSGDTTRVSYTYNGLGQLSGITDPNGNTTSYTYNGQQVNQVNYPITVNGTRQTATHSYNYINNTTTVFTDADNHTIQYMFNTAGNVTQKQIDPSYNYYSSSLNLTTDYTWSEDEQLNQFTNERNNSNNYVYDNSSTGSSGSGLLTQATDALGHVIHVNYNPLGELAGVQTPNSATSTTGYNDSLPVDTLDSMQNDTMMNYLPQGVASQVSSPVDLGQNLAPNGNFEFVQNGLPTDWQQPVVNGSGHVSDTVSQQKYGSHSIELDAGNGGSYVGDSTSTRISVMAFESYRVSSWMKSSNISGNNGQPAGIAITWLTSNGSVLSNQYVDNMAGTNDWTHLSGIVTAPSGASAVTLTVVLFGDTGSVWYDGIQLTPIDDPLSHNQLLNPSFQNQVIGALTPTNWSVSNASDVLDTGTTHSGFYTMKLYANSASSELSQTIPAPGYHYSGLNIWGSSMQDNPLPNSNNVWGIRVTANYSDGGVSVWDAPFSGSGWQNTSLAVGADQMTRTVNNQTLTPISFTISAVFDNQSSPGSAWFNDLGLSFFGSSSTVGMDNQLENPGYELTTSGNWPSYWNGPMGQGSASMQSSPSSAEIHGGQRSLALFAPATSGTESVSSQTAVPYSNQNFTLIGYIHTINLSADHAYIRLDALDSNGNLLASFPSEKIGKSTANSVGAVPWTRVDVEVSPDQFPAGTVSVSASVALDADTNGGNAQAYFDDLSLVPYDLFTSLAYDANTNYVTSITDELGHVTQLDYQGNDNSTGGFSSNFTGLNTGDPIHITDPNGNTKSYAYTKFDQIAAFSYNDQNNGTVQGETFGYTYDGNGNLTAIHDPYGYQQTLSYNELNELTGRTELAQGATDTTQYHYDLEGLLTSVDSPNGTNVTFAYDNANRMTGETYSNGDAYQFSYDPTSQLISAQQGSSPAMTFGYDADNQLQSETDPGVGGASNTEQFSLDANGNLLSTQYSVGNTNWAVTATYDAGNHILTSNDGKDEVQFQYTGRGTLASSYDVNSQLHIAKTYLASGLLSEVKAFETDGFVVEDYVYTYDANGQVTSITNEATQPSQTITFSYDSLGQLLKETTWSYHTLVYGYDALGNRMSVTEDGGQPIAYTYDKESNRLTQVGQQSVQYDANGQMLSNGSQSYTWNAEGELVQVSQGAQVDAYTYDPLGRRVTVGNQQIGYLGQSELVGYITDGNNQVIKRFAYNGSGEPLLMYTLVAGNWYEYRYVYDGFGDIVGLVDDTPGSTTQGQEVVTYTYDAWGNLISYVDKTGFSLYNQNPFMYKGYWYDWDTGLYQLQARFYNPKIGRFLSEDPILPTIGDVLSYNEYAYAGNNPVNNQDPSGMDLVTNQQMQGLSDMMQAEAVAEENLAVSAARDAGAVPGMASEGTANALDTQSVANEVASKLGGNVSKIGGDVNSWKVTVPNGKRSIIVRIMESGSGGRANPYFRVSVDGKPALTLQGQFSSDHGLTHFDLSHDSVQQILDIIAKYKGR